jgi:hypothetical protein
MPVPDFQSFFKPLMDLDAEMNNNLVRNARNRFTRQDEALKYELEEIICR